MTDKKNKVTDAASKSMMDDLLPDSRDKKPPPKKSDPYWPTSYGSGSYGSQRNWDDDYYYAPPSRGSSYTPPKVSNTGSIYMKGSDIKDIIADAIDDRKLGVVTLSKDEYLDIVDVLKGGVGEILDRAGVVWNENAIKILKIAFASMLDECYFQDRRATRKIMLDGFSAPRPDLDVDSPQHDPITGEVEYADLTGEQKAVLWCSLAELEFIESYPMGFTYVTKRGTIAEMYYDELDSALKALKDRAEVEKAHEGEPSSTPVPSTANAIDDMRKRVAAQWCDENNAELGNISDAGFDFISESGAMGIMTFAEIARNEM